MAPTYPIGKRILNTEDDGHYGVLAKLNILAQALADNGIEIPAEVNESGPPTNLPDLPRELFDQIFFLCAEQDLVPIPHLYQERGLDVMKHAGKVELSLHSIVKLISTFSASRKFRTQALENISSCYAFTNDVRCFFSHVYPGGPNGTDQYTSHVRKGKQLRRNTSSSFNALMPASIYTTIFSMIRTFHCQAVIRKWNVVYGAGHGDIPNPLPHLRITLAISILVEPDAADNRLAGIQQVIKHARSRKQCECRVRMSGDEPQAKKVTVCWMDKDTDEEIIEVLLEGEGWIGLQKGEKVEAREITEGDDGREQ